MPTLTQNPDQIQQGDVTLEFIGHTLPEGLKPRPREGNGTVTLSMGSSGGHRHFFDSPDVTVHEGPGDSLYAHNVGKEDVQLKHTATHNPLMVKPGVHRVGGLNEMDHVAKRQRKVID